MPKILTINNAEHFGLKSGQVITGRFSGGEVSLSIKEDLKSSDVFVVGSINAPAENLLELLLTIDTAKRLGAKKITAVIPYFAYARADRQKYPGESVSAETIATVLTSVGGKDFGVITIDIHSDRMQGFFKCPFKSIDASDIFTQIAQEFPGVMVVAPDKGAELKALEFSKKVGLANNSVLQKERLENGEVIIKGISGNIGKKVLMYDDIIDSGGTILKGAEFLKQHGAEEIVVVSTHMVWQGGGYKKLSESELIKKIFTTDTIAPPTEIPEKIKILPTLPLLKKIIKENALS